MGRTITRLDSLYRQCSPNLIFDNGSRSSRSKVWVDLQANRRRQCSIARNHIFFFIWLILGCSHLSLWMKRAHSLLSSNQIRDVPNHGACHAVSASQSASLPSLPTSPLLFSFPALSTSPSHPTPRTSISRDPRSRKADARHFSQKLSLNPLTSPLI